MLLSFLVYLGIDSESVLGVIEGFDGFGSNDSYYL